MTKRIHRFLISALLVCLSGVLLAGCHGGSDADTNAAPPPSGPGTARPDPPNPGKAKNMPQGAQPIAAPGDSMVK